VMPVEPLDGAGDSTVAVRNPCRPHRQYPIGRCRAVADDLPAAWPALLSAGVTGEKKNPSS
jgi:hypothetical protein